MSLELELNVSQEIARGSERVVYQHPLDENLCIKVRYHFKRRRDENEREYLYAQVLSKFVSIKELPIAFPVGWVKTNYGVGLVCPLIRNDDGKVSQSLLEINDMPYLESYLNVFSNILIENYVSVTDLNKQNLVLRVSNGKKQVVMVDGFGFSSVLYSLAFKFTSFFTVSQTKRRIARLYDSF